MTSDKYITLFSNSCKQQYPANSLRKFRNKLCSPINLDGEWQVALVDLSFPFKCLNIPDPITIQFTTPCAPQPDEDESEEEMQTAFTSTPKASKFRRRHITVVNSITRSGALSSGYYRNVDELARAINSLYNDLFSNCDVLLHLDVTYSFFENRLVLSAHPVSNEFSLNESSITIQSTNREFFETVIGLDFQESLNGTSSISVSSSSQLISNTCNLPRYRRLYVCSDIIDYQHVGGTSSQLLASLVVDECGRCSDKFLPRYLPIRGMTLDTIDIELTTNLLNGEMFPLPNATSDSDYVECTLHLRRKSMLQSCI